MSGFTRRMEHALLDLLPDYDDRQDDGYGPDKPRVGDTGWLKTTEPPYMGEYWHPFLIVRDQYGWPAIRVGERMDGHFLPEHAPQPDPSLPDISLGEAIGMGELTLTGRPVGHAAWVDDHTYHVTPACEDHTTVTVAHTRGGLALTDETGVDHLIVGGPGIPDDRSMLMLAGYRLDAGDAR